MHRTHMHIIYHLLTPLYTFSHLYTLTYSFSQSLPVTDEKPTLRQLLRLNLPFRVGDDAYRLGFNLLDNDDFFVSMDDPKKCAILIFRDWLAGKGKEVTWEVLIRALRMCKLRRISYEVETALIHFRHSK